MSEPQYPPSGTPDQVAPPAYPPAPPPASQPEWAQPPPPAGPAPGWGQPQSAPPPAYPPPLAPAPAQPGWVQPPPPAPAPAQPGWVQPPPPATPPAQPSWIQPPAPASPQQGWGQPQPGQAGWVMPASVAQLPGHSMGRVFLSALFMLAAGGLTLVPAVLFVVGGSTLSDFLDSQQFSNLGDFVGGALIAIGVVMLVWALLEILVSLGLFMRRTWGRALGTVVGLFGGLFMTLILFGSLSAVRTADTVGSTGAGGAATVAIIAAVFVGYCFTLFACITGGAHFRRG